MHGITILGVLILTGLGTLEDSDATVKTLTIIIAILGIGWLSKKIVKSYNNDSGDIIGFTSWCLCGIPIISLIKLAIDGLHSDSFQNFSLIFGKVANFADKITFWN